VYLRSRELVGLVYTNSAASQWRKAVHLLTFQSLQQQPKLLRVCACVLPLPLPSSRCSRSLLVIKGGCGANNWYQELSSGLGLDGGGEGAGS
jgi:hypothetical protein